MKIKRRKVIQVDNKLSEFPEFLQKIYASRGILNSAELDNSLNALQSYTSLKDIDKACSRLFEALAKQQRILIVGDFDADGATSTALAISALNAFGSQNVNFVVPNRFDFGYGLSEELVEHAYKKFNPELIITVDNGISSIGGVAKANDYNIDVIITDHHLPGDELPKACAIVNPNQKGDDFPSKSIAGVGVIFYVMLALRRHLVDNNWFSNIDMPNMGQFLDLVALGTVADVVALDKNNRALVMQGLIRMRQGQCRQGIKALIEVSGRKIDKLQASDLGFAVAPRLNAAGRLDDMSHGIDCLLCDNWEKAQKYAHELDTLNGERRNIENEMKIQAFKEIEKLESSSTLNKLQSQTGICLFEPSFHQGVIGILAGRLKERFHMPVIVFAKASDTELKGSARSIASINIRDVLADIDKNNPGLILKFGGHAMAAGLSLEPSKYDEFNKTFHNEIGLHLNPDDCEGEILSDGELSVRDISIDTARILRDAGPWGQGFAEPMFDNEFEIIDQRIVGSNHLKLNLVHPEGGDIIDAIAFNIDLSVWPNHRASHAHLAYRLDINEYKGRVKVQLIVQSLEPTRIKETEEAMF